MKKITSKNFMRTGECGQNYEPEIQTSIVVYSISVCRLPETYKMSETLNEAPNENRSFTRIHLHCHI